MSLKAEHFAGEKDAMKKVRNILLLITVLGYAIFIRIVFNSEKNPWVQARKNSYCGAMIRNSDGSVQTFDNVVAPIYNELNKGMDPTPIPIFPPLMANGQRTEKWNKEQDGFYRAD